MELCIILALLNSSVSKVLNRISEKNILKCKQKTFILGLKFKFPFPGISTFIKRKPVFQHHILMFTFLVTLKTLANSNSLCDQW